MKNVEDIYTLSPMQQGILFHTLYAPNSGVYVEQLVCTLQGNLNISAFEQTWQQIITRHPILRTAFLWNDLDEPLQIVRKQVNLPWVYDDWQSQSLTKQQELLEIFLETDRNQGFSLHQAPLMRFTLIKTGQETYYFVWSHHHLLLDGWCYPIIFKEVFALYESLSTNKGFHLNSSRPYRDYIAWLQQQDLLKAQAFWRQELEGFSAPNSLIPGKAWNNEYNQKPIYEEKHLCLSSVATNTLKSVAQQHHLTLSTLLQGAWALLLSRYSGDNDVIFGTVVSGRPPDLLGVESMIGLFINTLPVRVKISDDAKLVHWLHELQLRQIERLQYSYSQLVDIHSFCDIPTGVSLFESILVFENYPVDTLQQTDSSSDSDNNLNNLQITNVRTFERTNYPLTIVVECSSELSIRISYDTSRFDSTVICRMLGHFQTLLIEGIASNLEQRLFELPWLTAAERHQLLIEWNNTHVEYTDSNQCLHRLFEEQVEKSPDAIAIVSGEKQLTYQQLNCRANQLAHYLKSLGVGSDTIVAISLERSLEMVIALLGVLKAGGAYLPLDPTYPKARLDFILKDADTLVLLSQQQLIKNLPEHKCTVCLDTTSEIIALQSEQNLTYPVTSSQLAYVIYTSGSTGNPKGVMIPHGAISNHMLWMRKSFPLTKADKVLQKTSFSFDASVWEFYAPLLAGAQLVMAPGGENSINLAKVIANQEITTVQLVPSLLRVILEDEEIKNCKSLKRVFCGGEALAIDLKESFFKFSKLTNINAELYNLYGPTETCIDATYWACNSGNNSKSTKIVPIGRPIDNIQVYILDKYLQPVPIGVTGELHISGAGLAFGYLNQPELNAEKFIPNPFSHEESRLYKTGDLARYLSNGDIEFVGRCDSQIKIRGFRIETEEIEAILNQHSQIRESVVIAREDKTGDQRLVAYIIPYQELLDTNDLSSFLKGKLPNYMIPSVFVFQSQFPLTPNGKIDRRALPVPNIYNGLASNFVLPRNSTEEILASSWAEVLKLEKVGIYDNFFELGGHSLLATQLLSRIRGAFSVDLPLHYLFKSPTIAELAQVIDELIEKNLEVNPSKIVAISRDSRKMKRSSIIEG